MAGLIPEDVANGAHSGYTFTYRSGPRGTSGRITQYTVVAQPMAFGQTGKASYFTGRSGVIRQTLENRQATANDMATGG